MAAWLGPVPRQHASGLQEDALRPIPIRTPTRLARVMQVIL
jgi:hypothetical protein